MFPNSITPLTSVKVCAYTSPDYNETPIACNEKVITSDTPSFELLIDNLEKDTKYDLLIIANDGEREDTIKKEIETTNTTIVLTSSASDTIQICGNSDTTITYHAEITSSKPTSCSCHWTVNHTDSLKKTTSLPITFHRENSATSVNTIIGEIEGNCDTIHTVIIYNEAATLTICEDCNTGSVTLMQSNCSSCLWINENDTTQRYTTAGDNGTYITSQQITAGNYLVIGTSDNGCSITNSVTICDHHANPCTISNSLQSGSKHNDRWINKEWGDSTHIDSVSDHEGNTYLVVQVGSQCWLAENMRCTSSPTTLQPFQTSGNSSTTAICYDNSTNNLGMTLRQRGMTYNWKAAMDNTTQEASRGICPAGWHIPTKAEWHTMSEEFNIGIYEGPGAGYGAGNGSGQLTGSCFWKGNQNNTGPNSYNYSKRNATGLSMYPTGNYYGGSFDNMGKATHYWTSTLSSSYAYCYKISNDFEHLAEYGGHSHNIGMSIRCLRD